MTITLAAVYTPIALQAVADRAKFREFALTLAGAVFISGVVALVLSPMMCANLPEPTMLTPGLADSLTGRLIVFGMVWGASRSHPQRAPWRVYIIWGGVTFLAAVMFFLIPMFATKELAPKEDQGFTGRRVTAPANATIDTIRYADAAGKIFKDIPDTRFTFQTTQPSFCLVEWC